MRQLGLSLHWEVYLRAFVTVALLALVANVRPVSAQGQIFVTTYNSSTITVYSRSANGNVAPAYAIVGQQGDGPHQVAINKIAGELIVTNFLTSSVVVYDQAGGVLKRMISGPSTGLNGPVGVDVDEVNGEIFVSNFYGDSITVYSVLATGDASPKRTIRSADLAGPVGLAVDPTNTKSW
jgi:DNA-binding beta-propeller fold protein YncE